MNASVAVSDALVEPADRSLRPVLRDEPKKVCVA